MKRWSDLKKFIDTLTQEQLNQPICFQDNRDNLSPVEFYIADKVITGCEGPEKVKQNMPYLAW